MDNRSNVFDVLMYILQVMMKNLSSYLKSASLRVVSSVCVARELCVVCVCVTCMCVMCVAYV